MPHVLRTLGPVLLLAALVGGCDLPTAAPSVDTHTSLRAPLLADKTYAFLGGAGEHEPLVDTTRTALDSLLAVGDADRTVYVEQEVGDFGVATLPGVLDKAARGLGGDTTLSGTVDPGSPLVTQSVHAAVERTNGPLTSPGRATSTPLPAPSDVHRATTPFPVGEVVSPPQTPVVDARGSTVEAVRLADASTTNRVAFTLKNGTPQGTPLTNGTKGEAPAIALRNDRAADPLALTAFGEGPIRAGETRTVVVDVSGARLGPGTTIELRVDRADRNDVLTTDTQAGLRYETATLSEPRQIDVSITATGVPTPAPTASRFASLYVRDGALDVRVDNDLSFPVRVDRLALENSADARALLPDAFPALGVSWGEGAPLDVPAGASGTRSAELSGRGLARRVDVTLQGRPATGGTVTLRADGQIRVAGSGTPTLSKMHFWPAGERVGTEGRLAFGDTYVAFERADDFVALDAGTLRLRRLENNLGVAFDSLTLSVPDIRRPDANGDGRRYGPGDSLAIRFVERPAGPFAVEALGRGASRRSETVPMDGLRALPQGNALTYHLQGTLETVPDTTKEHLRLLRIGKGIRGTLSVVQLDVRALRGRVRPLTVNVTPDADGDGRLDINDDAEARTASFRSFRRFANQVEGLRPEGGQFTLSVETDLGLDTRLYGALRGQNEAGARFLAGKGAQRVSASDPVADDFEQAGTPVGADRLLQLDVEKGPAGTVVRRRLTLTDAHADVDAFLAQLPTHVRFVGKTRVEGGRTHLQRPVRLDVGVGVRLPLSFDGDFVYRDTLGADLSGLAALTDPDKTVSVSSARLQVQYATEIPVGFEGTLVVLDADGTRSLTLPADGRTLTLKPAPKTDAGTAAGARKGTMTLDLSADEVRSLARGDRVRLRLRMHQQDQGPAVRVRADDTIRLSLTADVDATVRVGE